MLPLSAKVDLGVMAMKEYSEFPKALASLEHHHRIVYCHIQGTRWGCLSFCREAVGIFYGSSWLGHRTLVWGESLIPLQRRSCGYSTAPANWSIRTLIGGRRVVIPLQKSSRCILQPPQAGWSIWCLERVTQFLKNKLKITITFVQEL